MNEISKKIKELRDEVNRLECEIRELERKNSNFYIGVYSVGDGDYWDEYYCCLGFITEEQAKTWVEEQEDDDAAVYDAKYFEVTKEIYDKFGDWYTLDKLNRSINTYDKEIKKLKGLNVFIESVNKAIEDLAKEIGIEYLSFMHPASKYD